MKPTPTQHDFAATCSIDNLRKRAGVLKQIRQFFDNRDFFEVETPILSADVVIDRHIEPIPVDTLTCNEIRSPLWMQTSPEFAMKRLLACGADKIYQITKAFRNAERGAQHNPEFTMLEWYRVGDNYEQGRKLLADFAKEIFATNEVDQVSYRDAFLNTIGICPITSTVGELKQVALKQTDSHFSDDESRDEILNVLLSDQVEPNLGNERPAILFDFPVSQSALARTRQDPFPVAERFELYFRGVEIANGYHELVDADELRSRNSVVNEQRKADGKMQLPTDARLLNAMDSGLPECCGVAVGVDRLAMILLDVNRIDDVIAFPIEIA